MNMLKPVSIVQSLFLILFFTACGSSTVSNTNGDSQEPPACDSDNDDTVMAPTLLQANATSHTIITLTWNDNASNETGFTIERKTGTNTFEAINTINSNNDSYTDTGLQPLTTYTYRIYALGNARDSDYSNEATATTPALPPPVLTSAVGTSTSEIEITWTDITEETGYLIEHDTGSGFTVIADVAANTVNYTDSELPANYPVLYRLKAYNTLGTSPYSNSILATTLDLTPTASIRVLPSLHVLVGEEVYFDSFASYPGVDDPENADYRWDFGDDIVTNTAGRVTVHTYMRPGTFPVTLTITDTDNSVHTDSISVTVTGNQVKPAPRPSIEPILSYSCEDGLSDSSSNDLHGTILGTGDAATEGFYNNAFVTYGNNYGYLSDNNHILGGTNELTISLWARKIVPDSEGYILYYPDLFYIRIRDGGDRLAMGLTTENGSVGVENWYMGTDTDTWHHYGLIYDGQSLRMYFDGFEQFNADGRVPKSLTGATTNNTNELFIGARNDTTIFPGIIIDEVRIYDQALSIEEFWHSFELWRVDYQSRYAQYLIFKIPGAVTRNTTNRLLVTLISDAGYRVTLADKSDLLSTEQVLMENYTLPEGNYILRAQLVSADGEIIDTITERFNKPYDGVPRIGIDENNAIRIDGELYYPVTPWGLRGFDIDDWATEGYINTLYGHGYSEFSEGAAGEPVRTLDHWEPFVDAATEYGLLTIGPSAFPSGSLQRNAYISDIEEYVSALRDHPGMLAYMWDDEPGLGYPNHNPSEVIRAWTHRCHDLDKHHPVKINLVGPWMYYDFPALDHGWQWGHSSSYFPINNYRLYGRPTFITDIYGMDFYPVDWGAPHSRNATMAQWIKIIDNMRQRSFFMVPCMSFIETADIHETDGANGYPTPWAPTPDQLTMMIWINVIHGMKGINWFHWHLETPAENYIVMADFVNQITTLTPVVLSAELEPNVSVDASGARIDIMVRQYQNATYVFAVRVSEIDETGQFTDDAVNATISIEGVSSTTGTVYNEDRNITITSGSFTDTFNAGAVHIYTFPND